MVEVLQIAWYLVVVAAVIFYVILDGFDLGVGSLHLFIQGDRERRIALNSIGPFWDGNEVWLVAVGGTLFVGFPDVYAAVFSGFYILFMIFLAGIIFRAVAIEFRSKEPSTLWRSTWDTVFCLSSMAITFGAGLILGNLVTGVPLNHEREIYASFSSLFTPYTIAMGLFSIALFAMHGNHFLLLKTEDALQEKLQRSLPFTTGMFFIGFFVMTVWTWNSYSYMMKRFIEIPMFWVLPLLMGVFLILKIYAAHKERYGLSFLYSMLNIAFLFVLFAVGTFPYLVISSIDREQYSLTIFNSSSTEITLKVALTIALIGVPLVLLYGAVLYYTFRGKTKLHEHSY